MRDHATRDSWVMACQEVMEQARLRQGVSLKPSLVATEHLCAWIRRHHHCDLLLQPASCSCSLSYWNTMCLTKTLYHFHSEYHRNKTTIYIINGWIFSLKTKKQVLLSGLVNTQGRIFMSLTPYSPSGDSTTPGAPTPLSHWGGRRGVKSGFESTSPKIWFHWIQN